jgi:hypothetical protein
MSDTKEVPVRRPSLQSLALVAAGLPALGVGLAIALAPRAFYAGYGVALGSDPSLLSELRAPGAALAMLGAAILAGLARPAMARASLALGALVFLAYAAGRLVGLALDGPPARGLIEAIAIELAVGALCLAALRRRPAVAPLDHDTRPIEAG